MEYKQIQNKLMNIVIKIYSFIYFQTPPLAALAVAPDAGCGVAGWDREPSTIPGRGRWLQMVVVFHYRFCPGPSVAPKNLRSSAVRGAKSFWLPARSARYEIIFPILIGQ